MPTSKGYARYTTIYIVFWSYHYGHVLLTLTNPLWEYCCVALPRAYHTYFRLARLHLPWWIYAVNGCGCLSRGAISIALRRTVLAGRQAQLTTHHYGTCWVSSHNNDVCVITITNYYYIRTVVVKKTIIIFIITHLHSSVLLGDERKRIGRHIVILLLLFIIGVLLLLL